MLHAELIAPIHELLRRHAAQRGDKIAYQDSAGAVTYRALEQRTANLASHLADLGVAPGQAVAMLLPNSVAWIEVCLAIARAGAVAVPISYDASEPEIAYRIADADCRLIVATDEKAQLVAKLQAEAPHLATIVLADRGERQPAMPALRLEELLSAPGRNPPRDLQQLDDHAFIIYTSGTTGRAKGVILTVRGMLWVVAACWAPICGLKESDRVLSPLPLFHSYALNLSVLGILAAGASEYIMERFSTAEALQHLRTGTFTVMPGVPTMFHYLLQRAKEDGGPAPQGVRLYISAGAIMPATLNREFEARFGVPLLDGYGITETSTMVTMNWPTGGRILGSCGFPVPGLAVRIVDPATGADTPIGGEGELIVRGPNVMPGYHNKPAETAAALREGWYRTGDLARSDPNGFLTITGRLKELIIRGGQNIAPAEIEEAVCKHASVLDCAVIGLAHATLGEVPALFVVPRPGTSVDESAILAHCRAELSVYKVPASVHTVDAIPRTGSGKIMRFKLKELVTS